MEKWRIRHYCHVLPCNYLQKKEFASKEEAEKYMKDNYDQYYKKSSMDKLRGYKCCKYYPERIE